MEEVPSDLKRVTSPAEAKSKRPDKLGHKESLEKLG